TMRLIVVTCFSPGASVTRSVRAGYPVLPAATRCVPGVTDTGTDASTFLLSTKIISHAGWQRTVSCAGSLPFCPSGCDPASGVIALADATAAGAAGSASALFGADSGALAVGAPFATAGSTASPRAVGPSGSAFGCVAGATAVGPVVAVVVLSVCAA